ncbi:ABC transporter permease [Candidatus Woesearchaeota archaeon CG10_big_fil_rev_8_21_14_0_10_32_24]|nr:MAG: ABC transporter permease [Candidatus Woesearchaeota archaeon CG10_big_fil_rev_8_21_14_0_10_32_24]
MSNLTGMWTLAQREISRFLRVWQQTIIPPIITSTLFILIFGYSLGSRIKMVGGIGYLEFIIPGLLMMGVIMSAYMNTSSSLFISKFQKNIQEVLVSPLAYWQVIAALTLAAVLRALLVGIGILIVSFLFANLVVGNIFILLYFIIMVSIIFAFAGIATALWATSFDKMNVFATFLITPLTYLGGVFFSVQMLPPMWQNFAKFNPILYMVDGFRYGFIGTSDVNIWYSVILVFLLVVGFGALCVHLFKIGYKLRD